jgi:hypothetical protein
MFGKTPTIIITFIAALSVVSAAACGPSMADAKTTKSKLILKEEESVLAPGSKLVFDLGLSDSKTRCEEGWRASVDLNRATTDDLGSNGESEAGAQRCHSGEGLAYVESEITGFVSSIQLTTTGQFTANVSGLLFSETRITACKRDHCSYYNCLYEIPQLSGNMPIEGYTQWEESVKANLDTTASGTSCAPEETFQALLTVTGAGRDGSLITVEHEAEAKREAREEKERESAKEKKEKEAKKKTEQEAKKLEQKEKEEEARAKKEQKKLETEAKKEREAKKKAGAEEEKRREEELKRDEKEREKEEAAEQRKQCEETQVCTVKACQEVPACLKATTEKQAKEEAAKLLKACEEGTDECDVQKCEESPECKKALENREEKEQDKAQKKAEGERYKEEEQAYCEEGGGTTEYCEKAH